MGTAPITGALAASLLTAASLTGPAYAEDPAPAPAASARRFGCGRDVV